MTLIVDSVFRTNVVTVHYLPGSPGNLAMAAYGTRRVPGPTVDECRRVVELVSKYT